MAIQGRPGLSDDRKDLLLEAGVSLASELSLPLVLQRIVDLAARVTGARYGALGVLGPNGSITQFITAGLSDAEQRAIGALPTGKGILGALITDAAPLRLRSLSQDPRSVGFPPGHPPMSSFLGAPVRALGRVYGNIYLTDKRGADEFSEEDRDALVVLATQAGVAVANAHVLAAAERRGAWLAVLGEVMNEILSGQDVDTVLAGTAGRARRLAEADLAVVVVPSGDGLAIAAADGLGAEMLRGRPVPPGSSLSEQAIRLGRSVVVEDVWRDTRPTDRPMGVGRIGPAVCVPLRSKGESFGALWVANRLERPVFDEETIRHVETFASQAAVALEYGRAQRDLGRLVLLEDRERIGRDLHDGIVQSLFAVGMGLQGTAMMVGAGEVGRRLETAVDELDRVIRDLRGYIFGLRPSILAARQLDQALRDLAGEIASRSALSVKVEVDERVAAQLAPRAPTILQMAREALSNVARHAAAANCRLTLREELGGAALVVEDDGVGFDAGAVRPEGQGIGNLRDRAHALGGTLEVTSAPGHGTTVHVRVPL